MTEFSRAAQACAVLRLLWFHPDTKPARAQVKADGGLKEFLFNWGYKRKLYHLEEGRSYKHVRSRGCG